MVAVVAYIVEAVGAGPDTRRPAEGLVQAPATPGAPVRWGAHQSWVWRTLWEVEEAGREEQRGDSRIPSSFRLGGELAAALLVEEEQLQVAEQAGVALEPEDLFPEQFFDCDKNKLKIGQAVSVPCQMMGCVATD